jgi:hypothetical protein
MRFLAARSKPSRAQAEVLPCGAVSTVWCSFSVKWKCCVTSLFYANWPQKQRLTPKKSNQTFSPLHRASFSAKLYHYQRDRPGDIPPRISYNTRWAESDGTVEKALFSITCTTCRARLVVRAEAAVGAILECPKCSSMVHVMPPSGWTPPSWEAAAPAAAGTSGPPPLDCVAESLSLELEPLETPPGWLASHWWLALAAAGMASLAIAWALWLAAFAPAETSTPSLAEATQDPGTAVPGVEPQAPPGPQSRGVKPSPPTQPPPTQPPPTQPPPTQPPPTQTQAEKPEAKPSEPDPFGPGSEDAGEPRAEVPAEEIKKLPPVQVDVAARLADGIPEIELTDVPLAKAVELLASMSTVPITLDPDAMMQFGVTARDPVSIHLTAATVEKTLRALAAKRGLAVAGGNGQVLVTTPEEHRETLRKVRYTVSDLAGEDKGAVAERTPHAPREAELAAVVRKLIAPDSWQGNGGRGTIEPDGGALVVTQTGEVHQQVLDFCEKLRNARQKPLRSRDNPQRFTLVTRLDRAKEMLDRPVTVNFHEPVPLSKILAYLAETTRCDILVDRAALGAAETSDQVEASLTAQKKPLGAALGDLLRPLGLACRAIDPRTIQITTKEALDDRMELEFYPVSRWLANSLLKKGTGSELTSKNPAKNDGGEVPVPVFQQAAKGVSGPGLVERIKARVAAATWSDVGGPGEMHFDPPSGYIIVLQSQPAQAAIQRLLAGK